MNNEVLRKIAEQVRKENKGVELTAPESVSRDKVVDVTAILAGFDATKEYANLHNNGEISRSI